MSTIRFVAPKPDRDPAKLLFDILFKRCKNKHEREAAIDKVIRSTGGNYTIQDTIAVAEKHAESMRFTLEVFRQEADSLTNDDFAHIGCDLDGNFQRYGGRGEEVLQKYADTKARYDLCKDTITQELQTALEKHEFDADLERVIELSKNCGM